LSFPRRRESGRFRTNLGIPAFAGMTNLALFLFLWYNNLYYINK